MNQHITDREAAVELYSRLGWPIFEVYRTRGRLCACWRGAACKSPGKHPARSGWQAEATSDLETLRRWLRFRPDMNLGLATGRRGLIALDIDVKNGGDESLRELTRKYGELPETAQSLTGGGGWHYLFRDPEGLARNSAGTIAGGVDIRGEGGLIVLPPSNHASGRVYHWDGSAHPEDIEPALLPDWLATLIRASADRRDRAPVAAGAIPSGRRNETLLRIAGAMRRIGASERAILAALETENTDRCAPPLDAAEVAAIVASVMRYAPGEDHPGEPDYVRKIAYLSRKAGAL